MEANVILGESYVHKEAPILLDYFKRIDWAVLGVITWADKARRADTPQGEQGRQHNYKSLLWITLNAFRLRRPFRTYQTLEQSPSDECHYHFLIASHGIKEIKPQLLANTLRAIWRSRIAGAGNCWIEPFDQDRKLDGLSYWTKDPTNEHLSRGLLNLLRRTGAADGSAAP